MANSLDRTSIDNVAAFVCGLQQEDGSFRGDIDDECDTRFTYCALATLALLGRLDEAVCRRAGSFLKKCQNVDGGFGLEPVTESHAGQMFCCLAALKICNALDSIDVSKAKKWLEKRQCANGGLNGRPEKNADGCYGWWTGASLHLLGYVSFGCQSCFPTAPVRFSHR
eukprot:m.129466 g.129466  ORF g.129466 m.129466 type:complete len:168 (-) comp13889_c0_seq21:95-598(-)